jgi:excinuclease ABC subunit B
MDETKRRRTTQQAYNDANNITPQSIIKPIDINLIAVAEADYMTVPLEEIGPEENVPPEQMDKYLAEMEEKMREAARKFDFKQAAAYRDRVRDLRSRLVLDAAPAEVES